MSARLRFAFISGAIFAFLGCTNGREFPRLVDIPDAPAQATPMEEKRKIAQDMVEKASGEEDTEAEKSVETGQTEPETP